MLRSTQWLAVHLLIPALVFWAVFDVRVLDPTNYEWLLAGDMGQHFIGWHFFRYDAWRLPLAETQLAGFPHGFSIVFSDSNPLVSILLKPFSDLIPERFQFIGIWYFVCLILKFHAITLILRRYIGDPILVVGLATLFSIYPPFFLRFGHENLMAHFLWLYALYVFLADFRFRRGTVAFGALAVASAGIHFYFTPVILALSLLKGAIAIASGRGWLRTAGEVVVLHLLPLALVMAVLGYFGNYTGASEPYGVYSMNLNAFWNPMGRSWFLDALPTMPKQYEGFQYIGLGWMLVFFAALAFIRVRDFGRHEFLLVGLCVLLIVFALSNEVYWGQTRILSYPLPDFVADAAGIFRSSGRFVWFVAFVAFILAARWLARAPAALAHPLVGVAVVIQALDIQPLQEEVQDYATPERSYAVPEIRGFMDVIGPVPSFVYILQDPEKWVLNLGLRAAPTGVPIANMHLARHRAAQRDWYEREREAFQNGKLLEGGLYVSVNQPAHDERVRSFRVAGRCANVAPRTDLAAILDGTYPDITNQPGLSEVLASCGEGCAISLAIKDEGTRRLSDRARRQLRNMGAAIDGVAYRDSYAGFFRDGALVRERRGTGPVRVAGQYAGHQIRIESAGNKAGSSSSIRIDGRDVSPNRRGFNVATLEKDGTVESYWFDTYAGECSSDAHVTNP